VFGSIREKETQVVQLTTNYRSTQPILELANSVVDLIELLFPQTIDHLFKEHSVRTGPKPLVVMPMEEDMLRDTFLGHS